MQLMSLLELKLHVPSMEIKIERIYEDDIHIKISKAMLNSIKHDLVTT